MAVDMDSTEGSILCNCCFLLLISLIRQKFQKIGVKTDCVLAIKGPFFVLVAFLEEDGKAWEPIEPFWVKISQLASIGWRLSLNLIYVLVAFAVRSTLEKTIRIPYWFISNCF